MRLSSYARAELPAAQQHLRAGSVPSCPDARQVERDELRRQLHEKSEIHVEPGGRGFRLGV